jgi:hypothetical protein
MKLNGNSAIATSWPAQKPKGVSMYLSFWLVSYWNLTIPLEWFDDARWASNAIPRIRDFAGAANLLAFAGSATILSFTLKAAARNPQPGNGIILANTRSEAASARQGQTARRRGHAGHTCRIP